MSANSTGTNVGLDFSKPSATSTTTLQPQSSGVKALLGKPPAPNVAPSTLGSIGSKAMKVGASLLAGMGTVSAVDPTAFQPTSSFDLGAAAAGRRGLVGGTGSGGGQFLSQAQIAQQEAFARKLMELA